MDKLSIIGRSDDAKALAIFLGCKRFKDSEFAVRYGNRRTGINYKYVLNDIPALEKARDKLLSLEIFEKNDIRVPKFGTDFDNIGVKGKFIRRKKFHKAANDIDSAPPFDYWIEFIPVKKEYRFHIFRDNILQVCLKYKEAGTDGAGEDDDWIRNLEHGWKFTGISWNPDEKGNKKATEFAIKAVKCLGLDFGAVDVILGKDNKYYVLEVNTAPGLDTIRTGLYIKAINEWIDSHKYVKVEGKLIVPPEGVKRLIKFYNKRSKT